MKTQNLHSILLQACSTLQLDLDDIYRIAKINPSTKGDDLTVTEWLKCCELLSLDPDHFMTGYNERIHRALILQRCNTVKK